MSEVLIASVQLQRILESRSLRTSSRIRGTPGRDFRRNYSHQIEKGVFCRRLLFTSLSQSQSMALTRNADLQETTSASADNYICAMVMKEEA